ncbi:electron transport complex subunit RsxG [Halieaceae bacterium IMCC14734]|uniref:Ion-translocating oxidoreductase complex subunit G n=1 Tax=Candidatus Litorirhabdus singularis TaxID=2518993 RepID=A0ABT3TL31_9GAMM|nr:electron transport complex subunit RsxG [Candidatus Litorirhabdus singularis]MCX2982965.1 electron transport complex subunit RsxG [Candidatus Litorirhabdus singularis]
MMGSSISRNSIMLGLFAIMTTALIAGTYLGTRDMIVEAQRKAQEKALLEIIPGERHDNSMLDDTLIIGPEADGLRLSSSQQIFIARQQEKAVAVILPVTAPDGYSGAIDLIVGINSDGSIAGVRVLTHKETPGLGDKVDLNKSDWILSFNGTSLRNPMPAQWKVKKDKGYFDQFTGATITPRAVTAAIKRSLEYFQANQQSLLAPLQTTPIGEENSDG